MPTELFLYKVHALNVKGKRIASFMAIGASKFDVVTDCMRHFPKEYRLYDYEQIRPAKVDEVAGIILTKNDTKRKNK